MSKYNKQQEIIEKQDLMLDNLNDEMKNLKEIALHIGNEVDEQDVLLNDLSENTENANIRVNNSNKKIDKLVGYPLNKDFGTFKQHLTENCSGEWIYQLDADEIINEQILQNLSTKFKNQSSDTS